MTNHGFSNGFPSRENNVYGSADHGFGCLKEGELDRRVQELLHAVIASVWCLELLLLLRRSPSTPSSPADLVTELRSSRVIVDSSLERLERGGLVARDADGSVCYAPASDDLDGLVQQLEDEYRLRPDFVRRAIVSAPDTKLKSFADAFVLRKPRS